MSDRKIKVTDKRLFTSEGELKNEYRDLEDAIPAEPEAASEPTSPDSDPPPPSEPEEGHDQSQPPPMDPSYAAPTFYDLVGVVAQPIALYLGDAKMPDGESLENLELARLYIDLLDVLRKKSEGNLTPEEKGFVDDLLYQLRLRFVEKNR